MALNYIFACGTNGQVRWKIEGGSWNIITGPNSAELTAIIAFDTNNIWVCDRDNRKIWYYNGSSWTDQHTFPNSATSEAGFCFAGSSTDQLYCSSAHKVGTGTYYGYAYKYNSATGAWDQESGADTDNKYAIAIKDDDSQICLINANFTGVPFCYYKNLPAGGWTSDSTLNPTNVPYRGSGCWDSYSSKYWFLFSDSAHDWKLYSGTPGSWTLENSTADATYSEYWSHKTGNNIWCDPNSAYVFYGIGGYNASASYENGIYIYNGSTHTLQEISLSGGECFPGAIAGWAYNKVFITCYNRTDTIAYWNGSTFSNDDPSAGGTSASYNGVFTLIGVVPDPPSEGTDYDSTKVGTGTIGWFCQIDGINDLYWQYSSRGTITHASRTVRTCLHINGQYAVSLDPKELVERPDGITFLFDDIIDASDQKRYFGKLFNDSRWQSNSHSYLSEATAPNQFVERIDETFDVIDGDQLTATSYAYMGYETIYITNISTNTVTAKRGYFPCIDGAVGGETFARVSPNSQVLNTPVSMVPWVMTGRRIALYRCQWDYDTGAWGAGVLYWAGYITDHFKNGTQWTVNAESVLKDLNKTVYRDPSTTLELAQNVINLQYNNAWGTQRLLIEHFKDADKIFDSYVNIPSGIYASPFALCAAVNEAIRTDISTNVTYAAGKSSGDVALKSLQFIPWNGTEIVCTNGAASNKLTTILRPTGYSDHWWLALGLPPEPIFLQSDSDGATAHYSTGKPIYSRFSPVGQPELGGQKIYVEDNSAIVAQGDKGAGGFVSFNARLGWKAEEDTRTIMYYSGVGSDSTADYLTVGSHALNSRLTYYGRDNFVGQFGLWTGKKEEIKKIKPVLVAEDIGPFEFILRLLESSGTYHSNGAYDIYGAAWGLNLPENIIDEQSFIDADQYISCNPLSNRQYYVVEPEETYYDVIKKECLLFGFSFGWRNGKIGVYRVCPPRVNEYRHTISEDNILRGWIPGVSRYNGFVNSYQYQIIADRQTKEITKDKMVVNLANSVQIHGASEAKVEHAGINVQENFSILEPALQKLVKEKQIFGYRRPYVSVALPHTYVTTIFVGDVVKFSHNSLYDIFGSGDLGFTAYALVTSKQVNFATQVCTVELLLIDFQSIDTAWGGSACTNQAASNGGWASGTKKLTLIPVRYGDKVSNILKYSGDLSDATWTKNACTISADVADDPDGYTVADAIIVNNLATGGYVSQTFTPKRPGRWICAQLLVHRSASYSDADYVAIELEDSQSNVYTNYYKISKGDNFPAGKQAGTNFGGTRFVDSTWQKCFMAIRLSEMFDYSESWTIRVYPTDDKTDKTAYTGDGTTKALTLARVYIDYSANPNSTYISTTSAIAEDYQNDTEDGVRFSVGDKIRLYKRDANSSSIQATVVEYDATANTLEIEEDISGSWDSTVEWVIVPDVYGTATASQQDENAYLADDDTKLVSTDQPYRW